MYNTKREFERDLNKKSKEFTKNLKKTINKRRFDAPNVIVEAVKYSLFADSKRIRPILTLEVARA